MSGNRFNNVQRWNTKIVRFNMQQSNHGALSDVIVHKECYAYAAGKEVWRQKFIRFSKVHKFNNKYRIVCMWEAQLVKAVSLNLTHPFSHVIPFLSYFLRPCIDK